MAIELVNATVLDACLTAEADAIREKLNSSDELGFDFENQKGFAEYIEAISVGSGGHYNISSHNNGDGTQNIAIVDAEGGGGISVGEVYPAAIHRTYIPFDKTKTPIMAFLYSSIDPDVDQYWFGVIGINGVTADATGTRQMKYKNANGVATIYSTEQMANSINYTDGTITCDRAGTSGNFVVSRKYYYCVVYGENVQWRGDSVV